MPRRIVLTGGPGGGKSSLIEALARQGYPHAPEAGRAIIRDQVAIGGRALPWADVELFAELMLAFDLRSHGEADGTTFFDRGIVDTVGYLRLEGRPVPEHLLTAARAFGYDAVFVAPYWPEIYTQDAERKQSPEVAKATCEAVVAAYREFGYSPVELPLVDVEQRRDFVLGRLAAR
ncbi:AAA family ATPase [Stackebrandtia nassauensis]|uniref:NadR/Ttd14 AAA domain-containing protein n=1 Tax=Stackebrandtia nassauensis (strain DSM 44728 / CIP 108903 / NRRL B-16338 / NBRC 102104 / LLR-40K-21) TaxID=446470 RepID=D3QAH6_STANL|nr:AAA family ATPase [Stackebrandtia nassauensis]ADD42759.1 conserved hypothetical protein [Stackebrandtia nassauensis DSM 44728]